MEDIKKLSELKSPVSQDVLQNWVWENREYFEKFKDCQGSVVEELNKDINITESTSGLSDVDRKYVYSKLPSLLINVDTLKHGSQSHSSESKTCAMVGWGVMVLGILTGLIFILVFGKIEVELGTYYTYTEEVWSGAMVGTGLGIMLNGFLVGYLFLKISSILAYHERNSKQ